MIPPGSILYSKDRKHRAIVHADASIEADGLRASIHKICSLKTGKDKGNGWTFWHLEENGCLQPIDEFRYRYEQRYLP